MFNKNTKKPVRVPAASTLDSSQDLPSWVYAKPEPMAHAATPQVSAENSGDGQGDIHARKAYLRAVISRLEVGDENIRIIGEKTSLEKAVGTALTGKIPVSGLVRKWCTRSDSNARPSDS